MKVGITKPRGSGAEQFLLHSNEPALISLSEWDALDLVEIPARKRARIRQRLTPFNHQIIVGVPSSFIFANSEVTSERISIVEEIAEDFNAKLIFLRLTAGRFDPGEIQNWVKQSEKNVWVDQGREEVSRPLARVIIDPLWQPTARGTRNGIFKLHGWHPSRWIRYYGHDQLLALKKMVKKSQPRAVLFAHSMRNEEAIRFQEMLRESTDTLSNNCV